MTEQASGVEDLLMQRLARVKDISTLNAEIHKLSQTLAGAQIELQRCLSSMERQDETSETASELRKAEKSVSETEAAIIDCEQRLTAVEEKIAAIDGLIEARTKDGSM